MMFDWSVFWLLVCISNGGLAGWQVDNERYSAAVTSAFITLFAMGKYFLLQVPN